MLFLTFVGDRLCGLTACSRLSLASTPKHRCTRKQPHYTCAPFTITVIFIQPKTIRYPYTSRTRALLLLFNNPRQSSSTEVQDRVEYPVSSASSQTLAPTPSERILNSSPVPQTSYFFCAAFADPAFVFEGVTALGPPSGLFVAFSRWLTAFSTRSRKPSALSCYRVQRCVTGQDTRQGLG